MTDRKQGAGLSSGSSAAVHKVNWGQIEADCHFGTHAYNALNILQSLILDINEDRTFLRLANLNTWCCKLS